MKIAMVARAASPRNIRRSVWAALGALVLAGGGLGLAGADRAAAQTGTSAAPLRLDRFMTPSRPAKARKARASRKATAPAAPVAAKPAPRPSSSLARAPAAAAIAAATGTSGVFDEFDDGPVGPSVRAFAPLSAEGAPPARVETLGVKVAPPGDVAIPRFAASPLAAPAAGQASGDPGPASPPIVDAQEFNEIDRAAAPVTVAQASAAGTMEDASAPRAVTAGPDQTISAPAASVAGDVRAWSVPFILTLAGALAAATAGLAIFRRA
ncbi:MAG TPA: hypothetical protein VNQ99_07785 [Xanthobacteraceae bacterium]|nr:hypothetical protein [Xanthobacteraceae bacterium]